MIDAIRKDAELGTQDRWSVSGVRSNFKGKGHQIDAPSLAGVAWIGYEADQHNACMADARRIARVPDMEAALLAAEELADAVDEWGAKGRTEATAAALNTALGNYRAATGGAA